MLLSHAIDWTGLGLGLGLGLVVSGLGLGLVSLCSGLINKPAELTVASCSM